MEQHDRGSRGADVEIDDHVRQQHTCARPVVDVWMRAFSASIYLFCVGGVAALLIWLGLTVSGNARDGLLVVGYALAALALVGFVRSVVIEVAFEPERLIVRNPLRTRHLAWSAIVEVGRVPDKDPQVPKHVRLRLRDGSTVSLRAVAAMRRYAHADHLKVAARLRSTVEAERAVHASRRRQAAPG